MAKQIIFGDDSRQRILQGTTELAEAVRLTLGSQGQNVVLENGFAPPKIVNDGVTIAKSIQFKDRFKNVGALLMIQAAEQTNQVAGDGTTATIILAQEMYREGLKHVTAGVSQMAIRRGINAASKLVIAELKKKAKPIRALKDIVNVATISSGDPEMGQVIGESMSEVGRDGVVTVEEWSGFRLEKEVVKGIQFDRGFIAPHFITNPRSYSAEYKDALFLITTYSLETVEHILPAMKIAGDLQKPLVVVAPEIRNDALAMLIINKLNNRQPAVAIQAPGYGQDQEEQLEDLAILLGGTVVSEKMGIQLKDMKPEHLGQARKIVVDRASTTIIEGKGKKAKVSNRIAEVKAFLADNRNNFAKEHIRSRLGKLSGKVAVIKVGAATEPEIEDKKLRLEDALNATRSAIEEGIVPGGGVALYRTRAVLKGLKMHDDEQVGVRIVYEALTAPIKQVIQNAGESVDVVLERVNDMPHFDFGFDSNTSLVSNMVEKGIIDPVKVIRTSLESAASVAGQLLTANAVIVEDDDNDAEKTVKMLARAINPPAAGS